MFFPYEPGSKLLVLGMVIQPLIGNPYNEYINPYYWVDDHPLIYGNNGSLDLRTYSFFNPASLITVTQLEHLEKPGRSPMGRLPDKGPIFFFRLPFGGNPLKIHGWDLWGFLGSFSPGGGKNENL